MTGNLGDIDLRALRQTLGCFVTGVTVVTALDGAGAPRGFTANSFTSVSLEPPLILFCIGKNAGSFDTFRTCGSFAVNILSESQREISNRFAGKVADRFAQIGWQPGQSGAPLLEGALGWLECTTEERIDAGDHVIVVGRVIAFRSGGDRPLGYFRGAYVNFGLEQKALYDLRDHKLVIGCIAQQAGQIMLCRRSREEGWTVPNSALAPSGQNPKGALQSLFDRLGADIKFSFLFSVFSPPGEDSEYVVYRGGFGTPWQGANVEGLEARLFAFAEMPWQEIKSRQVSNMLRRYWQERASARFGIYVDSPDGGQVAALDGPPSSWQKADPPRPGKEGAVSHEV